MRKDLLANRVWTSKSGKNRNTYANSSIFSWGNDTYAEQFSGFIKDSINSTNIRYIIGGGNKSITTLNTKIFILSAGEFGSSTNDGEVLPILSMLQIATYNGNVQYQWTRTPINYLDNVDVHVVDREGNITSANTGNSGYYPRPCFTIKNTILCDGHFNLIENTGN